VGDGREEPLVITPDMLAGAHAPRDFERGMRMLPPLTLLLIACCVAMFAWEIASGALSDRDSIVAAGALTRDGVLAGEWWRLISAPFLHAGPDHLIGNCLVLYIVGLACEHALGFARTAVVYFASALGGAGLSVAFRPGPSVGASGAIFGVLASVVVVLIRYRHQFYVRDKRIAIVLAAWAAWQVLTGLANPFIDNFAHLGGIAGGALVTLGMKPRLLDEGTPG
jgi:rhomboid protease GluP